MLLPALSRPRILFRFGMFLIKAYDCQLWKSMEERYKKPFHGGCGLGMAAFLELMPTLYFAVCWKLVGVLGVDLNEIRRMQFFKGCC